MFKPREELDQLLAELEAELPAIEAETSTEGFMVAFSREADLIMHAAGPDDLAHVRGRIDCILAARGLIPGENEGEPCA